MDPGRGRTGLVPRLRGLVARHLAAHRDFRRPGGADVDPAGPGGPGGHAGPAVGGAVRARPRHGRLRAGVLGIGGPARPPDRGDARVRHRGPRAAGRPAGHGRADHRQGRLGSGRARVAAVRLIGAGGSAAGSGLPGRARPADAPARRAGRRRSAAQLGHARAHRGQPGADRRGRRPGRPRAGLGPDDHVHPGVHRRRRGRGAAGVRRAGTRLRHGPARYPAGRGLPGPVRPDGVRCGAERAGAAAGPGRGHARAGGRGRRGDAAGGRLLRPSGPRAGRVRPAQCRARRDHRPDRHRPARPGAGQPGHGRADASAHPGRRARPSGSGPGPGRNRCASAVRPAAGSGPPAWAPRRPGRPSRSCR